MRTMVRAALRGKGPRARTQLEQLSALIDQRDGYTAAHSRRVVTLSVALGEQLGLPTDDTLVVRQAALSHDIGKLAIPDSILLKPAALSKSEWRVMRSHAVKGAAIVADLGFCKETIDAVRYHHEHFNGSGYPSGLAGEEIPLAARIVHVADAIDSMTSKRVYQQARPLSAAVREIRSGSGNQFCPQCVEGLDGALKASGLVRAPRP